MTITEPRSTKRVPATSAAAIPMASTRWRRRGSRFLTYALLTALAIPFLLPVYWMVVSGLKSRGEVFAQPSLSALWPADPQWQNLIEPFRDGPFLQQFWNSFYIAAVTTAGVLFIASLAGYAFARIRFRGRGVLFVMLLSTLLLPPEVTITPLFRLVDSLGWVDSHLALIIPHVFGVPCVLGVFLMRQFFLGLPLELEQAAWVDGLTRFGFFRRVAIPLAKAPLATLAILSFLNTWNTFLEPLVFLRSREMWTVPVALQAITDPYTGIPIWNLQMAATTLSVIPVITVFVLAQRYVVQGIASTGIK